MYHVLSLRTILFFFFTISLSTANREKVALLQLKASISDPANLLSNWIVATNHCSWQWISCDSKGRIFAINISSYCPKSRPFRSCYSDPHRSLAGKLSPVIAKFTQLKTLSIPFQRFYGDIPREIWGLGNLEVIDFEGNLLAGRLPLRFPRSLRVLNLAFNMIAGKIPISVSKCIHLETLDLSGNSLVGSIPNSLGNCSQLQSLLLFSNRLNGIIPPDLGRLRKLQALDLSKNCLSGCVPEELGNCKELALIVLTNTFDIMIGRNSSIYKEKDEFNYFRGGISWKITSLPKLRILWVPNGNLEGEFPRHWGICKRLEVVSLGKNRFSGEIPRDFNKCVNIKFLDLSLNRLTGWLSEEIHVPCMDFFDVSGNNLSGNNPRFIYKKCCFLPLPTNDLLTSYSLFFMSRTMGVIELPELQSSKKYGSHTKLQEDCLDNSVSISISHVQNISGESQSYARNNIPTPLSPTKSGGLSSISISAITSAAAIVLVLVVTLGLYIYSRKCVPSSSVQSSDIRHVTIFVDVGIQFTYNSIVTATGNFNTSNCIGSGGFGATYKAEVSPGVFVAIKRLSVGRFQGVQQFLAEIKTLGRWRHPNLVTLIGYYGGEDEMFLIYNYLPGGNLEKFIQERGRRPVDWKMLHKIALDVARALAYLHDQCVPHIIHRDVKPSNILLDNDCNAYLSDFGLARLMDNSETHATTSVAGTFGYVAPEYAITCRVSDKADVYSYGVVLLELMSDKKALDPSFSHYGDGFNIVSWASMLLRKTRVHEFFSEGLWLVAPHQQLIDTLKLAIRCTEEHLSQRPSMRQIVCALKELQPSSI